MKNNKTDETAVTAADAESAAEDKETKQPRQSLMQKVSVFLDSARGGVNVATNIYSTWIKPVYDNRAQISRRLNAVSTAISIIFFMLYVPFLLFGKLYKDLAVGWDIALYVCIGVYVATIIALFAIRLASGKSTSTAMAKKHKQTRKIILFIVRVASLAIGITALVISAANGSKDETGAVLDTIAIIFAVMSIIFSSFPLIFGGAAGFFKWLISPAKVKFRFSVVALEWYQSLSGESVINKSMKKLIKKYGESVGQIIDGYLLPQLGKRYIKSIDRAALLKVLETIPQEKHNLAEWTIKQIFEYAEECGYVLVNPCKEMELEGDIQLEEKQKKAEEAKRKRSSFFSRKNKKAKDREDETD